MTQETTMIFEELQKIGSRLDGIDTRLDGIDTRLDRMEIRQEGMEKRLEKVEIDTAQMKTTLENEIRRDIKIIAEGHLDLNRKLEESLKGDGEIEMIKLRLSVLENDMKSLKMQVGAAQK